jgi:hypothetical protein
MEVSEYLSKKKCYRFLCLVLIYLIPGQVFSQSKYDSLRVVQNKIDNTIDSFFYNKGVLQREDNYKNNILQSSCYLSSKGDSIYFDRFYGTFDGKRIREIFYIWDSVIVGAIYGEEMYGRYYFCTEIYQNEKLVEINYREFTLLNSKKVYPREIFNHGHFRYRIDVITSTKGRQRKKIHFARINYQSLQVDWLKTSEMCP